MRGLFSSLYTIPACCINMDKNLVVYPISKGDELNIFSTDITAVIKIMDMQGNIVAGPVHPNNRHCVLDIKKLSSATYIVEATFQNNKTSRSVFVKL